MFEVIAIISLAVFFVFAFFICHHKKNDERDDYVLFLGERFGFIAGSAILMIGLLIQAKAHEVDIWMAVAFTGMILAKIVGMIYAKLKY